MKKKSLKRVGLHFSKEKRRNKFEKNRNGVKTTLSIPIYGSEYLLYDRESNDVKRYSPICN